MQKRSKLFLSLLVLSLVSGNVAVYADESSTDTPSASTPEPDPSTNGDETGNGDTPTPPPTDNGGNETDDSGSNVDDDTGGSSDDTGSDNGSDSTGSDNNGNGNSSSVDDDGDDETDDETENGEDGEEGEESEETEDSENETQTLPVQTWTPPAIYTPRPTTRPVQVTGDTMPTEPVAIDLMELLASQLDNPAMVNAFEDYQFIYQTFYLLNEETGETAGATLEEFLAGFITDSEPEISQYEDQKIYTYTYYTEEDIEQLEPIAYLNVHFIDNELVAISFHRSEPNLDVLASAEELQALTRPTATFRDIVNLQPNVIGLVHKNHNEEEYDALVVPSGNAENIVLNFIEVTPTYTVSEFVERFDSEDEFSDIINAFVSSKHAEEPALAETSETEETEETEETSEPAIETGLSFGETIMANRNYDEAKLYDLEELAGSYNEALNNLHENGQIDLATLHSILGEPTTPEEMGASQYDNYYAFSDEEVIIVSVQYDGDTETLLELRVDHYKPIINEDFQITIDELFELANNLSIETLTESLSEASSVVYSPSINHLRYVWSRTNDSQMERIEFTEDLTTGVGDLFYVPVE